MPTRPLSRELAEKAVNAVNDALSKGHSRSRAITIAAASLRNSKGEPLARQTLQSQLYTAKRLYDLEPDWSLEKHPGPAEIPPPPDGFKTAGISTLYNKETGEPIIEWVKLSADAKRQEEIFREVIDELTSDLPRVKPVTAPKQVNASLMACYPVGDHHLGMMSWHEETGTNYDLKIAEKLLTGAMDHLVWATPSCDEAAVVFLGDFLHIDSFETVTPTGKNPLDTDSRFPKMVRAAIRSMRYLISAALAHHKKVRVIVEIGNHDLSSSIFLMECLANIYEDETRLTVDTSPRHVHYFSFGKCLIGTHHGHDIKMEKLPLLMANDRPGEWGNSLYRYWWTGHIHHQKVMAKDYTGVSVESFRVLCPNDAWGDKKGYRPIPDMKAIILHRDFGEVARYTVNPRMLA